MLLQGELTDFLTLGKVSAPGVGFTAVLTLAPIASLDLVTVLVELHVGRLRKGSWR